MDDNESQTHQPAGVDPPHQEGKAFSSSLNYWLGFSMVVMILSLSWFFYAIHRYPVIPPKPVSVVSAWSTSRDVPVYLPALGNVLAVYNVTIRTQINGVLERVLFKEGQLVKQGKLLAEIDPRPYQALLMQYRGNLKRDLALLANARVDLQRYQHLWKQNSVAQQTLATQQSLVKQYEGVVKTDRGLIASTKLSLLYCRIRSPINGRIGLRFVDPGNFIQTADTSGIAMINTVNPITVVFTVPEDNVSQLIAQFYSHQLIKVLAYDRQENQLLAMGRLLTIDNQIDPTTGTIKLKAVFNNKNHRLFPNQFVNIKVLLKTIKQAVLVPTAAIQHTLTRDFIYLVKNKKVVAQTVKVGPSVGSETVIRSGLTAKTLVVVDGADKLVDGATIVEEESTVNS